MTRPSRLIPVLLLIAALCAAPAAADETDRLARLARVWATVKYLHPFMLQRDIDWDGALVRAIPNVRAASTDDDFARAIGSMLKELDDRATGVVQMTTRAIPARDAALFERIGDSLLINLGPYAEAKGAMALFEERAVLTREMQKAQSVIIDLRLDAADPDGADVFDYLLSSLSGFTSEPVTAPSKSYVTHSGYRPQQGSSGGYYSALLTVAGATLAPVPGAAAAPSRVIFVTDGDSKLPEVAVALRAARKALVVSNEPLGDDVLVDTTTVDLGGSWRAVIRVSQMSGTGFAADVVAADPLAEALAIVKGKTVDRSSQVTTTSGGGADVRWRPDPVYRDMLYPDVAHRLLAAFRIWSVIHYFYPYKALIGDWDAALTDAIPQFIAAANENDYVMAVLQMVARVEDGHSSATGHPAVARMLGTSGPPFEVRQIENEFVVTRLYEGIPTDVNVQVGDIVLAVDGEPLRTRVDRLRRYVTASTEEARMNRIVSVALRGENKSILTLNVRGADSQVRSVSVPRVQAPQPRLSGEPFRVLDGNVGYVDLTRLTVTDVDRMFDALKATTAIIFDMRGYPRGTAWSIAPRINTKGAKVGALFRRVQLSGANTSEESAAGFYFEQPLPQSEKPTYSGRTVMLIDDRAISQSEHTALFFEAANDITFIGTHTAGANGDVTSFFLPGGFRVGFTGHDVRHADGRQLQRVGIQPHIRVAPTIEGLRAGRDEVLERALTHLKQ